MEVFNRSRIEGRMYSTVGLCHDGVWIASTFVPTP
jgi:hypothetical protein